MHLVTTALREFWPESGPIWLLTPGCLPDPDDLEVKQRWEIKGIVSDPWRNEPEMTAAYAEIWRITQDLIGLLAGRLNVIHNTEHSERYWRTHIGFWALLFVTAVFDRHARLCKARAEIDRIEVIGRNNANRLVSSNTTSFDRGTTDDLYNSQIYTFLCEKMGIPVVEHRSEKNVSQPQQVISFPHSRFKKTLRAGLIFAHAGLASVFAPRADILMVASYLPRWFEIGLTLLTAGKVFPLNPAAIPMDGCSNTPFDDAARTVLSEVQKGAVGIDALVVEMVHLCIPKAFVEDYQEVCRHSDLVYKQYQPKAIYSANAWWFNEAFKHWAASCQEKGAKLIGGAHGSAYFVRKHANLELFEVLLSDAYLTWGWSEPDEPKLIPVPACKLIDIARRSHRVTGEGILYVGTSEARHNVAFLAEFSEYLEWRGRFFLSVSRPLVDKFLVRLHYMDFNWRAKERLVKVVPNIQFDSDGWDVSFRNRLSACRLFVCDHLSTTYAEALAANVPTVLFWNEARYPIRDTAMPYIRALKACQVLHDTPESAAIWVAKIYDDPGPWWLSDSCQKAVKEFCYLYARTGDRPLRDWKNIFESIVR